MGLRDVGLHLEKQEPGAVLLLSGLCFHLSLRSGLAVQAFQASDDFFGRQLAASFPTVQVSMRDDVIHGKDSLQDAFVVNDGQAAHLLFRHGAEGLVNFLVGFTGKDWGYGDVSDRKIAGQPVPGAQGDTDVAIGDDAYQSVVLVLRKHAAVVGPQEFDSGVDVGVWFRANSGWCHYVADFHDGLRLLDQSFSTFRRCTPAPHDPRW